MGRIARKRIKLFVEGDTEENYFKNFSKCNEVELIFTPVNMNGGGYNNFLKQIRRSSSDGFIAIFIVIDLDKLNSDRDNFNKLVKYCETKNKDKYNIPHFLIGNNKDFEIFACCHCNRYNIGRNTKKYIEDDFNYRDLDKFKSDKKVYDYLNKDGRSYGIALDKLSKRNSYIQNKYTKKIKGLDIKIKIDRVIINEENEHGFNSNINEFFEIVLADNKV